jgi:outer membrane protein OmpA-like peptidoglycan-associated protein
MKKMSFYLILMLGISSLFLTVQAQQATKYDIRTAYVYKKEMLLISDTDLNCSYFIRKGIGEDIRIIGSTMVDWNKKDYSDSDKMFINKGSTAGVKEKDIFLVIEKGSQVSNPLTGKNLGTFYLKKALCEVTCLYENRAEVTLKNGCHPVNIGDYLVKYEPQKTVFERKPIYTRCRMPDSVIEGNVVFAGVHTRENRVIAGPQEYVTVDLGKAMVSRGDFLLFYKILKADLPPLIVGTGIVIDSQNTNSTAKILDASGAVEVGYKLVLLQAKDLDYEERARRIRRISGEEEVPVIEKLEKEDMGAVGEESLDLNILFNINEKNLSDPDKTELDKVKDFIQGKSEFVIILRGYSCSIGNEEYNLRLSKERVDNVKKYLMDTLNIKEEFFETYHYGEKESPYDNTSEEERRKNRLVTVQVVGRQ